MSVKNKKLENYLKELQIKIKELKKNKRKIFDEILYYHDEKHKIMMKYNNMRKNIREISNWSNKIDDMQMEIDSIEIETGIRNKEYISKMTLLLFYLDEEEIIETFLENGIVTGKMKEILNVYLILN